MKAAAKEKKQRLGDKKEGWGGGLATAGYTKVRSAHSPNPTSAVHLTLVYRLQKCALPADHIGRIPGVPVGTTVRSLALHVMLRDGLS